MKIKGIFKLLIPVVFLVAYLFLSNKFLGTEGERDWVKTKAVVTKVNKERKASSGNKTRTEYVFEIEFETEDGKKINSVWYPGSATIFPIRFSKGDTVNLKYDMNNPAIVKK